MIIKRTANAGVLIKTEKLSILLDGVCDELLPYEKTPNDIKEELILAPPHIIAFSHRHKDHYSSAFAKKVKASVITPESEKKDFPELGFFSVETRHIGKNDVEHQSFVLEGEKCVWFMGDASPVFLEKMKNFQKPDALIIPYAYAITKSAWERTLNLGADKIILLHMPKKEMNEMKLWKTVEKTTMGEKSLIIPAIGETIIL